MVAILRKAIQKCLIIVVLRLLVLGLVKGQKHVCLKQEIVNNSLILKCKVDSMGFSIRFSHNNKTIGDCLPYASKQRNERIIHCNENITQNLETNVTTLRIPNVNEYNVSGVWICKHGSYTDDISISILEIQKSNLWTTGSKDTDSVVAVLVVIIVSLIGYTVFLLKRLRKKTEGVFVLAGRGDTRQQEKAPLLAKKDNDEEEIYNRTENEINTAFMDICYNCKNPSTCAICSDCENLYCGICCKTHTMYYPNHIVCQTEHFFKSQNALKCKICIKEISTNVCKECRKVLCKQCIKLHKHNINMLKELNPDFEKMRLNTHECDLKEITFSNNIPINIKNSNDMIKVCGIAFLSDCRIVVIDNKNNVLMVFEINGLEFQENLNDEPRGIAQMNDNKIAITFAYIFEIRIFKVVEKATVLVSTINILNLDLGRLKPFSISYDQEYFAVEAGEGDDGCILLLNSKGKFERQVFVDSSIAHFSANTIRIALDMRNNGNIFISGMSRKSVSCINLDGKIIWTIQLPEPRGIVVIPEETLSRKNIIVASKSCSAVFRLNRYDGDDTEDGVVLAKGIIKDPRYIAYHPVNRWLCIHVTKGHVRGSTGEQQLLLYKYKEFVDTYNINEGQ